MRRARLDVWMEGPAQGLPLTERAARQFTGPR
jgi:hypothetical protein